MCDSTIASSARGNDAVFNPSNLDGNMQFTRSWCYVELQAKLQKNLGQSMLSVICRKGYWQDCRLSAWPITDMVVQYRDLAHDTQLAITVWECAEGKPRRALGGTTLRLFSKKGRLKSGRQMLRLWMGREADAGTPSGTPGKVPLAARGELG